jgi:hypothetical protein
MAKELKSIDISAVPALLRIVEEASASGEAYVLTRAGEEVAVLRPLKVGKAKRRPRKSGIISESDSLWNIVGMGQSEGPGDISENKHKYLAEVYADLHFAQYRFTVLTPDTIL